MTLEVSVKHKKRGKRRVQKRKRNKMKKTSPFAYEFWRRVKRKKCPLTSHELKGFSLSLVRALGNFSSSFQGIFYRPTICSYVKRGLISIPKVVGISLSIHQLLLHPPETGMVTLLSLFCVVCFNTRPIEGRELRRGPPAALVGYLPDRPYSYGQASF